MTVRWMRCVVLIGVFASTLLAQQSAAQVIECVDDDGCQVGERCLDDQCRPTRIVLRVPPRPAGDNRLTRVHLRFRADGLSFAGSRAMRVARYVDEGELDAIEWRPEGHLCTRLPRLSVDGRQIIDEDRGEEVLWLDGQYVVGVEHLANAVGEDVDDTSRQLRLRPWPVGAVCDAGGEWDSTVLVVEVFEDLDACEGFGGEAQPVETVCSTTYRALDNGPIFEALCEEAEQFEGAGPAGIMVALDGPWAPYVEGPAGRPASNCRESRPSATHFALMLDGSGSMGTLLDDGAGQTRRIDALSAAVKGLFRAWSTWRSSMVPGDDHVGVVLFAGDARPIEAVCAERRSANLTPDALADAADDVPGYISHLLDRAADLAEQPLRVGAQMRPFGAAALDFIGSGAGSDATPAGQGLCDDPAVAEVGDDAEQARVASFLPFGGTSSYGDALALAMGPDFLDLGQHQAARAERPPEQRWHDVALFISDGQPNTPCHYHIDDDGVLEFTRCGEQPEYALLDGLGRPTVQVHTIALDTGGLAGDRLEALARLTGGTYHHVDTLEGATEDALRETFLDVLQNALRLGTWHIARRIAIEDDRVELPGTWAGPEQNGPIAIADGWVPVHVPTTAKAVSFVAWWTDDALVRLEVWPPNAQQPLTRQSDRGRIEFASRIRREWHDPSAPWRFRLQRVAGLPLERARALVFVDHDQLRPQFEIDGRLNRERGRVRVTAQLQAFGRAVHLGDEGQVYLNVRRPDASLVAQVLEVCGEDLQMILDEIELRQQLGDDPGPLADELIAACRQAHPDLISTSWHQVEMRDNGEGADRIADDGVYSASFPGEGFDPLYEGHYQVYVNVDGVDPRIGRFQLSHRQTLFVTQEASPDESEVEQEVQPAAGNAPRNPGAPGVNQRVARITVIPRDALGNPIGPGRAGYIWLRFDDARVEPLPARDNLDGTYSATFSIGADDAIPYGEAVFIDAPVDLPIGAPAEIMLAYLDGPARGEGDPPLVDDKASLLVQLGRFGGPTLPPPVEYDSSGCACGLDAQPGTPHLSMLLIVAVLLAGRRRRHMSRHQAG